MKKAVKYNVTFTSNAFGAQTIRGEEELTEDQLKTLKDKGEFKNGIFAILIKLDRVIKITEIK